MSRCVKVICVFLGKRRSHYNNPSNMQNFLSKNIDNEISIENGINTDVILINNKCDNDELNNWVNSYNGIKTKNGKIIVEHRENIGGSFGAYFDMFNKYCDNYDFWFFCEDDHIIFKDEYIKDFIEYLESDSKIGYVCLAPITPNGLHNLPSHSGGGIGLTSNQKFKQVYGNGSICNFRAEMTRDSHYHMLQNYESKFNSNFITYGGFELRNHPKYSPLPKNYKNFEYNYVRYLTKEALEKEFIYNVGE